MAIALKKIESEFILKSIIDTKSPCILELEREKVAFSMQSYDDLSITLLSEKPCKAISYGMDVSFSLDFHGLSMSFKSTIISVKENQIIVKRPVSIYRALTRSFHRIPRPTDISCTYSIQGERFALDFPKRDYFESYEEITEGNDTVLLNIKELLANFDKEASVWGSNRELVLFKTRKPESFEEKIITFSGKALYIPTIQSGFPLEDPYPNGLFITRSLLLEYIKMTGTQSGFEDQELDRLLRNKRQKGILSELYMPIDFHEYVLGYVHIWNMRVGFSPLDYKTLEKVRDFSRIFTHALKVNNYFSNFVIQNPSFNVQIFDVSSSGALLFQTKDSKQNALLVNTKMDFNLKLKDTELIIQGKVVRKFEDSKGNYFGIEFMFREEADFTFFYNFLYGRLPNAEEIERIFYVFPEDKPLSSL